MNRKAIWAVLAVLGFSTACSSVKNAPRKGADADTTVVRGYGAADKKTIVMYGVRPPKELLVTDSLTNTKIAPAEDGEVVPAGAKKEEE